MPNIPSCSYIPKGRQWIKLTFSCTWYRYAKVEIIDFYQAAYRTNQTFDLGVFIRIDGVFGLAKISPLDRNQ